MSRVATIAVLTTLLFSTAMAVSAQNAACEPRVDTSSLLSGIDVNVTLSMSKLYARCLPMPVKKSRTNYEYHPYDGGKFSSTLKTAKGETINTYVWYGENILSLWEMSRYEVVGGPEAVKKLSPGNYVLEFAVEDKVFQTFPFSFGTKQSNDQFRPETLYFTDGMWRDYAHIYSPGPERFFQLVVWLRNEDSITDPKRLTIPYRMRLIRDSDKKAVAESDANSSVSLDHKWHDFKLSFRRPGAAERKDYSEFKLSEIAAVDGKYHVELAVEGMPVANYPLIVKNGRINDVDLAQMKKESYRIILPLSRAK